MPYDPLKPFREKPDIQPEQHESGITLGTVFDTQNERYCVALGEPDIWGQFDGIDSEGRTRTFSAIAIEFIHINQYPLIRL